MVIGYEVTMYRDISRIAKALERIAEALEKEPVITVSGGCDTAIQDPYLVPLWPHLVVCHRPVVGVDLDGDPACVVHVDYDALRTEFDQLDADPNSTAEQVGADRPAR